MNTEEAIGLVERYKYAENSKIDEIIRLLKRGEKYEEIWEELVGVVRSGEVYTLLPVDIVNRGIPITVIVKAFENIEQKYFPKDKKIIGRNWERNKTGVK